MPDEIEKEKIVYEPHPVTPARKKELRAKGFKIIDERFSPDYPKILAAKRAEAEKAKGKGKAEKKTDDGAGDDDKPFNWNKKTVPELQAELVAREIEFETDANKPLLVKLLTDDDAAKAAAPQE